MGFGMISLTIRKCSCRSARKRMRVGAMPRTTAGGHARESPLAILAAPMKAVVQLRALRRRRPGRLDHQSTGIPSSRREIDLYQR